MSLLAMRHVSCRLGPAMPFQLTSFEKVSVEQLKRLIKLCSIKSCALDPVPVCVLQVCISFCPMITKMINLSLETGTVAVVHKEALLSPLLKNVDSPQADNSHNSRDLFCGVP